MPSAPNTSARARRLRATRRAAPTGRVSSWRRSAIQEFVQDDQQPGILYNHDNEFLHYQDDWYILGQRENEYVVVYYRGSNDAWDGYGGAVVYSKEPVLPAKWIPEITDQLAKINIKCAPALALSPARPTDAHGPHTSPTAPL